MHLMIPVLAAGYPLNAGLENVMSVLVCIVGIIFGWIWTTQFVHLMLMSEIDFPGRFDKLLWGAAFIVVFPFAPFAFWGWKSASIQQKFAQDFDPVRSAHD